MHKAQIVVIAVVVPVGLAVLLACAVLGYTKCRKRERKTAQHIWPGDSTPITGGGSIRHVTPFVSPERGAETGGPQHASDRPRPQDVDDPPPYASDVYAGIVRSSVRK